MADNDNGTMRLMSNTTNATEGILQTSVNGRCVCVCVCVCVYANMYVFACVHMWYFGGNPVLTFISE